MNALWTFPHLQAYVDFGLILVPSPKNVLHTFKKPKHWDQDDAE